MIATRPKKPKALPILDNIPADLTTIAQWVMWQYIYNANKTRKDGTGKGDFDKPPKTIKGKPASSTDPTTWTAYDVALASYRRGGWDGFGIVLTDKLGLVGIDLDNCRDPKTGKIKRWAREIIRSLRSYTEISPSGKGIRIICKGAKPAGRCRKGPIEMYDSGRYLTITGQHLPGTPTTINRRTNAIARVHAAVFGEPTPTTTTKKSNGDGHHAECDLSDSQIMDLARHAKNSPKFNRLWSGDTTGYPSKSEADLALSSLLAFYTGDQAQIDRLIRRSGLAHEKWDRADYRDRTIGKALEGQREHYTGSKTAGTDDGARPKKDSLTGNSGKAKRRLKPMSARDLIRKNKHLPEPVIEGIIRAGETCNIIGPSKIGKSWLAMGLAISIAVGRPWLGHATTKGRVLIVDNELHEAVLADRLTRVAEAMNIPRNEWIGQIDVLPLRGRLCDYEKLGERLIEHLQKGEYAAIIVDAHYRMIPSGISENDNAALARIYNLIDQYAERTRATWFLVHHSNKGNQADKSITDVGAGAGAQSRAADTHLILRAHEEENHYVLDAAVRSWPPLAPVTLKWDFPIWTVSDLDPTRYKQRPNAAQENRRRQDQKDRAEILKMLAKEPLTKNEIRKRTGWRKEKVYRLIDGLLADESIFEQQAKRGGKSCTEFVMLRVGE